MRSFDFTLPPENGSGARDGVSHSSRCAWLRTAQEMTMVSVLMLMAVCGALTTNARGERHVRSTDGLTAAHMQGAHEEGYTCWLLSHSFTGTVCKKDVVNTTAVPTTAQDLRRVLYSVNLRTWLPDLLCSAPGAPPRTPLTAEIDGGAPFQPTAEKIKPDDSSSVQPPLSPFTTGRDGVLAGREQCREDVEAALRLSKSTVWATLSLRHSSGAVYAFASIDEVPWVKAMEQCLQPVFRENFVPFDCYNIYSVFASQRGEDQLLPALQNLWRRQQLQQQRPTRNEPPSVLVPSQPQQPSSSQPPSSPSPPSALSPAAGKTIESLLSLLNCDAEKSGGIDSIGLAGGMGTVPSIKPFMRMFDPKPATRVGGRVVAFIAEVNLGEAMEARLLEAKRSGGGNKHGSTNVPSEHRGSQYRDSPHGRVFTEGGGEQTAEEQQEGKKRVLPPFHRCEVRVVADGEVAARIALHNDGDPRVTITSAIATSAAGTDDAEDADKSEEGPGASSDGTRSNESTKTATKAATTHRHRITTVVTPDYTKSRCSEHPFKAGGLATGAAVGGVSGLWGGWDRDQDTWHMEAREVDRVCTRDASGPHHMHGEVACCYDANNTSGGENEEGKEETCEVWASSEAVEYLHTGAGESESHGFAGSLLDAPPKNLSVSLHLEGSPDVTTAVVSVPRWSSDGDVWEAAFDTCSEAFGPLHGVLVNLNDCVDLITTSISEKRADLYHSTVLRLDAYIKSVHANLRLEGHTGAIPEKVEALGGMARNGGERVRTVCEVGFNAGHSSLNWLLNSDPSVRVMAFDLGEHDYVVPARDFLQAVFPERLQLILGDSSVTVPAHTAAEVSAGRDPGVCDVTFVDGDHSEKGAHADLINFRAKASRGWNAFALDDMELSSVSAAWRRFSREEDEEKEEGSGRGTGRGRIEHVVRGSAERYTYAKVNAVGDYDITYEDLVHRIFAQRGYFSLGLGSFSL